MTGPGRAGGRDWLLVALGFAVVAFVVVVWLALDRRPPEWDHANQLERVVACAQDLERGDVRTLLARSSFYPPLVPCAASVLYRLVPTDAAAAQAVMLAFLAVGMVAVFLTGRALAGGPAGVVAAWTFASAPFVVFLAMRFQLDLPLATMVGLALLVLLSTPGLRHPGWSALLGLVLALGMLTKPTYAAYVAPSIVVVLLLERSRRMLLNAALAAVVAGALSLPWYGPRVLGLPAQASARSFRQAAESGHAATLSREALLFYPTWIWTEFGVIAVLLALGGVAVGIVRRQWALLAAAVVPLVLFTGLQNKNLRYVLPALPAIAVVAGLAAAALPERARRVVLVLVAVAGVAQVTSTAFAVPPPVTLPGLGVPSVLASPPARRDWRQRDFLRIIAQDRAGRPATVSVVPNDNYFSVSNFRYYAVRDELPMQFMRPWQGEPLGIDYMILKTGEQGPAFTEAKSRRVMERLARDPALARAYPVIAELPLPDGSTGTLRARRITDPAAAAPDVLARSLEAALRRRLDEVARDVDGLEIRLAYDAALAHGHVQRLEVRARSATVGELRKPDAATLRIHNLRMVAEDVLVNPYALEAGRAELFDVGRLRLERMDISAPDLQTFVAGLKPFRRTSVRLAEGAIDVVVEQPGPDVAARVRVVPAADRPFAFAVERARLGGVPLPRMLVDWVVRNYDPTPQIASRLAFPVSVARVTVREQAIRVGE